MNQLTELWNELKDKKLPSATSFGVWSHIGGTKAFPRKQTVEELGFLSSIESTRQYRERLVRVLNTAAKVAHRFEKMANRIEDAEKNNNGLIF
jgi:hypothetical protein